VRARKVGLVKSCIALAHKVDLVKSYIARYMRVILQLRRPLRSLQRLRFVLEVLHELPHT
jgi:hypothetical protein